MKDPPPPVAQPSYSAPLAPPVHAPLAPAVVSAPLAAPVVSAPVPQPVAPQIQVVNYQVNGPAPQHRDSGLGVTVRTVGIVALSLMLVGFIPCLGWLNYLNIALSSFTIVLGIVAIIIGKSDSERMSALLGVGFAVVALFLGTGRLIIGGGCI